MPGFRIFMWLCAYAVLFFFFFPTWCVSWGNPCLGPVPGPQNLSEHRDLSATQTPPVSVIYRPFTTRSHAHTNTLKNTTYAYIWKRSCWQLKMKNLPERMQHVHTEKMRSGKCEHTETRYENACWGGWNSFDIIRMVKKNNGWQRKIKGAGAE